MSRDQQTFDLLGPPPAPDERAGEEADGRSPADGAAAYLPRERGLSDLAEAVQGCRGCSLHADATRAVFGEGPPDAPLMIVGEQPGDKEDLAGRPFVGPAGQLLDRCLNEAGIAREAAYVTNAVKHFKFKPIAGGKRRLHAKPSAREVAACVPWLEAEIEAVKPDVLLCLGATAAQSLLGPGFKVSRERGKFVPSNKAPNVIATVHPSSLLRARDGDREALIGGFVADLKAVAEKLSALPD